MSAISRPGSLLSSVLVLALAATGVASAKGNAEAGATKAATCQACHNTTGSLVNPEWPVLAGQNALYVAKQVKAFHSGARIDASNVMPPLVAALQDQDIEDIAAYYATLTPAGLEAAAGSYEAGRKLYLGGDRKRAIPACAACHGPTGAGNPGSGYPALHAQSAVYTAKQLGDYAGKARYTVNEKGENGGGDNANIMQTIAARLSAEEIQSLAAFTQGMR